MSKKTTRRQVTDPDARLAAVEQWVKKLSEDVHELRKALPVTAGTAKPPKPTEPEPKWDMSNRANENWNQFICNAKISHKEHAEATDVLNTIWDKWQAGTLMKKHVIIPAEDLPVLGHLDSDWSLQGLVARFMDPLRLVYEEYGDWYVLYRADTISN